ncbi:ATP-binding protein [Streptomyces sp. S1A1-7]|uniref:ATP-binding protein n=2 Tax=Streptomyces TaxID=1883 RepID=UPI0011640949|nr:MULTISPECIES: ATP-binding protein [Streptomyces]QDN74615.1 ATP-binding protein [Streptomyces sp. S1A1-7]QDO05084.1 ATP-binding protein [Streptomyces sp. S1D4-23]
MMTTAVRPPLAAPSREEDAMSTCFAIARRNGSENLPLEDARRVGAMRRLAVARLKYCGLQRMSDDVAVIVSELLTNAILHSGGTQITFGMTVRGGFLRISVHDGMPGNPEICPANGDAETGRGLYLVASLVDAHHGTWGIGEAGATIWCSLPL